MKKLWQDTWMQTARFLKLVMQLAATFPSWRYSRTSKKSCDIRCKLELEDSVSHLNKFNDDVQDCSRNIVGYRYDKKVCFQQGREKKTRHCKLTKFPQSNSWIIVHAFALSPELLLLSLSCSTFLKAMTYKARKPFWLWEITFISLQ